VPINIRCGADHSYRPVPELATAQRTEITRFESFRAYSRRTPRAKGAGRVSASTPRLAARDWPPVRAGRVELRNIPFVA